MLLGFHSLEKNYDHKNDRVVISKTCSVTGERYEVSITIAQAEEMASPDRRNIQMILPHRSADEREFLISGITPAEWNQTFRGDEDGED